MRGRRAERREGCPNGLERIGGGEGGNRVFQDEVLVDEILELFGGLHGGPGPALPHKPLGPADELGGSGDGPT